ncbi:MAG: rRNA maturation RNase YbeY [Flavobacterium sp.]
MIEINIYGERKKHLVDIDVNCLKKNLKKYISKKLVYTQSYEGVVLNYNFVSSRKQQEINKEFLNHDYDTDVITFDLSFEENNLLADLFISPKQVRKNASKYKTNFYQEMNRVIIHGCLHLLGYNDKTMLECELMRKEENKYLKYIEKNVPRGTINI